MYIPKRYGQSKNQSCPFCGKTAVTENAQGVYVCIKHKSEYLDLKCLCGEWLDIRSGKWGPYGVCDRCGNLSWSKILEANPKITPNSEMKKDSDSVSEPVSRPLQKKKYMVSEKPLNGSKKETVIRSDELDFM